MEEKGFNSLVQNVINQCDNEYGWCFKIPDPNYQEIMRGAVKRPLDLIGVLLGKSFFIESKFIKGLSAFNFSRIEEHQDKNLTNLVSLLSDTDYVGVFVAFWEPRTRFEFIYLDYALILYLRENGVNSIHKKTLQKLKDAGYFIEIKKKFFDLKILQEKKINEEVFRRVTEER